MLLTSGNPAKMPIRQPDAACLRRQIADVAAAQGGGSADYYLDLLGKVEPTCPPTEEDCSWRLGSYLGAYEDSRVIEDAVAVVQRRSPLMGIR